MATNFIIFCLILNTVLQTQAKSTMNDPDYVAAVVSYTPANLTDKTTPEQIVQENLNNYYDLISETKGKNVDILVFPEATLNYWGFHNNRSALLQNAITIPELNSNDSSPAKAQDQSEILTEISKRAAENEMYILINVVEVVNCSHENNTIYSSKSQSMTKDSFNNHSTLSHMNQPRAEAFTAEQNYDNNDIENSSESTCGKDGKILYNTNVVFDRKGIIISKYRKFNLFNEKVLSTEQKPELAIFLTDFGIQFGHFICFDIIFRRPAMQLVQNNVRHLLYPTLWFSELPFLTAAQVQAAWANSNNVVLLASGGNNPEYGTSGSGIYVGKHGALKVLMSPNKEKRVLIATVPKNPDIQELKIESDDNEFSPEDMQKFHTEQFSVRGIHSLDHMENKDYCEDYLCCSYEVNYQILNRSSIKKSYTYKAASGINERIPSPDALVKEAYCAILSCIDEQDPKGCGTRFKNYGNVEDKKIIFESIKIRAKFDMSKNLSLLAMPSTLDTSLLPLKSNLFQFHIETLDEGGSHFQVYILETLPNATLADFLTFGIHARIFTGEDNEENGSLAIKFSCLTFFMPIIIVISFLFPSILTSNRL